MACLIQTKDETKDNYTLQVLFYKFEKKKKKTGIMIGDVIYSVIIFSLSFIQLWRHHNLTHLF